MQTGSFFLPETEDLPDDVEEFLSAGPAPVYIGFGSMSLCCTSGSTGLPSIETDISRSCSSKSYVSAFPLTIF